MHGATIKIRIIKFSLTDDDLPLLSQHSLRSLFKKFKSKFCFLQKKRAYGVLGFSQRRSVQRGYYAASLGNRILMFREKVISFLILTV